MFQVFNIAGLLRYRYLEHTDTDPQSTWRISRLAMTPLAEDDTSRWEIYLTSADTEVAVPWETFLADFVLAEDPKTRVGAFVHARLEELRSMLSHEEHQAWFQNLFAHRRPDPATYLETLRRDHQDQAVWMLKTIPGMSYDTHRRPRAFLKPLLAGLDSDHRLVQTAASRAKQEARVSVVHLSGGAEDVPAELAATFEEALPPFMRGLDQAIKNSRNILSLGVPGNTPSSIEGSLNAALAGGLTATANDLAQQQFPQARVEARATVGNASPETEMAGRSAVFCWQDRLPVWDPKAPAVASFAVSFDVHPLPRSKSTQLEEIAQVLRAMLHHWLSRNREPLASGGDAWIGLVRNAPWDLDTFALWLGVASPGAKLRCLREIGEPPAGPETATLRTQQEAWDLLLDDVVSHSGALDPSGWEHVLGLMDAWSGEQQSALRGTLNITVKACIADAARGPREAMRWISVWRAGVPDGHPAGSDINELVTLLSRRCAASGSREDADLLQHWWTHFDRPASLLPNVADALLSCGELEEEDLHTLQATLPEDDERRQASQAVSTGLLGQSETNGVHTRAQLLPLAERKARHEAWERAPAERELMTRIIDEWIATLDQSADVDQWRNAVSQRNRLAEYGLYQV